MSKDGILEKLKLNRTPILLAEIGAWLHLIGRFSKEFIDSQASDADISDKFDYKKICSNINFFEGSGLRDLLQDEEWKKLKNDFSGLSKPGQLKKVPAFCTFIEKHTRGGGLCKLLSDAHGIVSGIDKSLAGQITSFGKQTKTSTFSTTAFGYEKSIELLEDLSLKNLFFTDIAAILRKIKNDSKIPYNIYCELMDLFAEYYPKTIDETRRPINEISLFDFSHLTAALVKSSLAKVIIDGWFDGRGNWTILRINFDVTGLLAKGLKVGDVLGYKNQIDKVFRMVKKTIEFIYPLGNELYRDSTGIYFSFPSIKNREKIESEILPNLFKINDCQKLDFDLNIEVSTESRSLVILGRERAKALEDVVFRHRSDAKRLLKNCTESVEQFGEDVCPVCRLNLKNEKAERCRSCKQRLEKRAVKWLNECRSNLNDTPPQTLWLDEVSDHNNKLVLLVANFDLENWLSGKNIRTFVSCPFKRWKENKDNQEIFEKLNIYDLDSLTRQFEEMFNDDKLDSDQKILCKSFVKLNGSFNFQEDFWKPINERDVAGRDCPDESNREKAQRLVSLLFQKYPSAARVRRVWETTKAFFEDTAGSILREHDYGKTSPSMLRRKRIALKIAQTEPSFKPFLAALAGSEKSGQAKEELKEGATIDIEVDGVRLSPVLVDEDSSFVTTVNLQLLRSWGRTTDEIAKKLCDKQIKVKTVQGWRDGFKIISAEDAGSSFQDYLPYTVFYQSPDQYMVLLPAADALEIAGKIVKEYELQYSKVRDRMPFHLGLIAFHRRTPLYLAMDAGRRLLKAFKEKCSTIEAQVKNIENKEGPCADKDVELELKVDQSYSSVPLKWKVSCSTKDLNQEDEWYPYFRVKEKPENEEYSFDYDGKGHYVVHVKKLEKNSRVEIDPSFFKFIFIENAADCFYIDEQLRPLDDFQRLTELWGFLEKILAKKVLAYNQLHGFWQEVEARKDYDAATWEKFIETALFNMLKDFFTPNDVKNLSQAAKDGLLELCLTWFLKVMKFKPETEGPNK